MEKPRVLIVDDDKDILMLLQLHFEKAGAQVVAMEKAPEALELVLDQIKAGNPHDLIVVDIRMPAMSGNELTKSIRNAGYEGGIIAFTSSVSMQGKRESNEAGIDRYLDKTTLKKDLVEALLNEYCPKS